MVTNDTLPPPPDPSPLTLTLGGPTDLVAAVPYLLGYHPEDSLVVLGARRAASRVCVTLCSELPDPGPTAGHPGALAARVVRTLLHDDCDDALAVGYGPAARVTPYVDALRAAVAGSGVILRDALRVTDGRYWSYLCPSPRCCPAEGVRYDPGASAVPATAVAGGLTARPGRGHARAALAPVGGADRERMHRATARAEARCARLWSRPDPGGHAAFGTALRAEGVRAVRTAVEAALGGAPAPDPDSTAWLGVVLVAVPVRDEAWARIDAERAAAHLALWRHVLRHVEPGYVAAPGSLLAFAAWLDGDVALADAALDRVDQAAPDYSMAALIRQALRCGVAPSRWRPFRLLGPDPPPGGADGVAGAPDSTP